MPDRVIAPFLGEQLDIAREVPLDRIGERALARPVLAVHQQRLTLVELDVVRVAHTAKRLDADPRESLLHDDSSSPANTAASFAARFAPGFSPTSAMSSSRIFGSRSGTCESTSSRKLLASRRCIAMRI